VLAAGRAGRARHAAADAGAATEYAWDWRTVLGRLQQFILAHLADPGAILVLDEIAELKKGKMTVGVARQHAGITGQAFSARSTAFRARSRPTSVRHQEVPTGSRCCCSREIITARQHDHGACVQHSIQRVTPCQQPRQRYGITEYLRATLPRSPILSGVSP
jgi:hypothetical protein